MWETKGGLPLGGWDCKTPDKTPHTLHPSLDLSRSFFLAQLPHHQEQQLADLIGVLRAVFQLFRHRVELEPFADRRRWKLQQKGLLAVAGQPTQAPACKLLHRLFGTLAPLLQVGADEGSPC